MVRYIALAWNPSDPAAIAEAKALRDTALLSLPKWTTVIDRPGLTLLWRLPMYAHGGAAFLHDGHGVVLGTLFRNSLSASSPDERVTELNELCTQKLLTSEGRSIVSDFWGSYVLFMQTKFDRTFIVRGPMSRLPCFEHCYRSISIFFSQLGDFLALGLGHVSVNWDVVNAQAVHGDYLTHETAVKGISTLIVGECMKIEDGKSSRDTYWEPRTCMEKPPVATFPEAVERMRNVTRRCIGSWGTQHDTVLCTLSGGLDSSIVLSCLARSSVRPRIISVNYFSPQAGDERKYARSMAELTQTALVEQPRNENIDLRMFLECAITPNPALNFSGCDYDPTNSAIAAANGASAIFDGELGDDLFGRSISPGIISELIGQHGTGKTVLSAALDYAILRQQSVWKTLYLALKRFRSHKGSAQWNGHEQMVRENGRELLGRRLASSAAVERHEESSSRFVHPWMRNTSDLPLGRMSFVAACIAICSTAYEPPFAKPHDPPTISALASQPLVELALLIPTYFHMFGGIDRSVARAAFREQLSQQVANRGNSKGTPELWLRRLINHNRHFLRDFLINGVLAERGILDRSRLESVLSDDVNRSPIFIHDVIVQLYIEAWVRKWEPRIALAVA